MTRKAARLERAGALWPRDLMWAAIRELAETTLDSTPVPSFSVVEVAHLVNARRKPEQQLPVDSVLQYVEGLSKAQPPYVEPVSDGDRAHGRKRMDLWQFRLVRDVGVEAPRVTRDGQPVTLGSGNEQMWAAMKVLRDFDAAELARAASAGELQVADRTASMYCVWLTHAGYLSVAAPANGRYAKTRYRFNRAKNTGPRAPILSERNKVIDGNTGDVVYERKGATECKAKT